MVCLQETAFVSVEMAWFRHRQDAAACVSLSKSTMSKTRPEASGPADNARRREERRLYPHPNSLSTDRFRAFSADRSERKNRFGAARGLPLPVRGESIEGAETSANMTENQGPRLQISVRPPQKRTASSSEGRRILGLSVRRKPFWRTG